MTITPITPIDHLNLDLDETGSDPKQVWNPATELVLEKHSGNHAITKQHIHHRIADAFNTNNSIMDLLITKQDNRLAYDMVIVTR